MISPGANGMMQMRRDSQLANGISPVRSSFSRPPRAQSSHMANGYMNGNNPQLTLYTNQLPTAQSLYSAGPQSAFSSNGFTNGNSHYYANGSGTIPAQYGRNGNLDVSTQDYQPYAAHGSSNSITAPVSSGLTTVGGFLAPSNATASARAQHSRAISLPAFSQVAFQPQSMSQQQQSKGSYMGTGLGLNSGAGLNGFGLAINHGDGHLSRWAEEDVVA